MFTGTASIFGMVYESPLSCSSMLTMMHCSSQSDSKKRGITNTELVLCKRACGKMVDNEVISSENVHS